MTASFTPDAIASILQSKNLPALRQMLGQGLPVDEVVSSRLLRHGPSGFTYPLPLVFHTLELHWHAGTHFLIDQGARARGPMDMGLLMACLQHNDDTAFEKMMTRKSPDLADIPRVLSLVMTGYGQNPGQTHKVLSVLAHAGIDLAAHDLKLRADVLDSPELQTLIDSIIEQHHLSRLIDQSLTHPVEPACPRIHRI